MAGVRSFWTAERRVHLVQNSDLTDIEASMQALVRRAYELGRTDALRKVVDVLNTDRPNADQLALTGPTFETHEAEPEPEEAPAPEPMVAGDGKRPWWVWPVR